MLCELTNIIKIKVSLSTDALLWGLDLSETFKMHNKDLILSSGTILRPQRPWDVLSWMKLAPTGRISDNNKWTRKTGKNIKKGRGVIGEDTVSAFCLNGKHKRKGRFFNILGFLYQMQCYLTFFIWLHVLDWIPSSWLPWHQVFWLLFLNLLCMLCLLCLPFNSSVSQSLVLVLLFFSILEMSQGSCF